MTVSRRFTRPRNRERPSGFTDTVRDTGPRVPGILGIGIVLIALAASCSSAGGRGAADEAQQLRRRLAELGRLERSLSEEYPLARAFAPYLVVDPEKHSVELKARGRSLRTFAIREMGESSGTPLPDSTWSLVEKRPLEKTERPKITPGAGEEAAAAAAKQALWGPHRMPPDYDLVCDEGRVLEIRALPGTQSGTLVVRWLRSAYRRLADRYRRWRTPESSRPRYSLQLWMSESDARLLFWSIPEKIEILVLNGPAARSAR